MSEVLEQPQNQAAPQPAAPPKKEHWRVKRRREAAEREVKLHRDMQSEANTLPGQKAERMGLISSDADFGIIEVGLEGLTGGEQTLGKFAPPKGFDLQRFAIAWGVQEAGSLEGWSSVAELQEPQPILGTKLTFPGWRVWHDGKGKEHSFRKGNGTLVMLYTLRSHWDQINKATGAISKLRQKAVEDKISQTNLSLPADVRAQQLREEQADVDIYNAMSSLQRTS